MVKCLVCDKEFRWVTYNHLKKHGLTLSEYLKNFDLRHEDLSGEEYKKKLSNSRKGKINIGDKNASKREEVRKRISESVKKRWKEGNYDDRKNYMKGRLGELSHNWNPERHTVTFMAENNWNKFLSYFQSVDRCVRCGRSDRGVNVHHIDEDHDNFLISNLEPLCVPCHSGFHYKKRKLPFVRITKIFSIAAAHYLPDYDGKCSKIHGHEWRLEVELKKRIDNDSGMVLDFSKLKTIVNKYVIDQLDHEVMNIYIYNPTAENILLFVWEALMFEALLKGIESVTLWETENSYSKLDKEGMLSVFKSNIEDYVKDFGNENL